MLCKWISGNAHIVCVYKPPLDDDLIIIELQEEQAIINQSEVVRYFTRMKECSLIIGGLTLKPPVYNFMPSNTNHRYKNIFANSIKNLPIQRQSSRITKLRTIQEVNAMNHLIELENRTINKVKNILASLNDRYGIDSINENLLKRMNERVERALKRNMKLEDNSTSIATMSTEEGNIMTSKDEIEKAKKSTLVLLETVGKNMKTTNDFSGKSTMLYRNDIRNRQRDNRAKPF